MGKGCLGLVIHSVYSARLTSIAAEVMKKVEATSFVTSYLEAWNEQDANSVTEHLCPNGHYIDEVFQQQISTVLKENSLQLSAQRDSLRHHLILQLK